MDDTWISVGFMDILDLPLDRRQRLDILDALARKAEFTVEDILLAAALLDLSSRSRINGRSLTPEQAAGIRAGYIDHLLTDADPEVYRILAAALEIRQPPPVLN